MLKKIQWAVSLIVLGTMLSLAFNIDFARADNPPRYFYGGSASFPGFAPFGFPTYGLYWDGANVQLKGNAQTASGIAAANVIGVLSPAQGGTGQNNLAAVTVGAASSVPASGVTGTLAIANGGTGQNNLAAVTVGAASTVPASGVTGTLAIANGGTNNTSFVAPSNGCNPIVFYNGTGVIADTNAYDICYSNTLDAIGMGTSFAAPRAKLDIIGTSTSTAFFTNTQAQGVSSGAGMIGYSDSGAAMLSGNRLGFYLLGGATNAAHGVANAAGFSAFATENWSGLTNGANIHIQVTPNGATTRQDVAIFDAASGVQELGTTLADDAPAGYKGEYVSATLSCGTPMSLTSGVSSTLATLTLTPGDWNVSALALIQPAATTTVNYVVTSVAPAGVGLTAGLIGRYDFVWSNSTIPALEAQAQTGTYRFKVPKGASPPANQISLQVTAYFGVSTATTCGQIQAGRNR